MNKKFKKLEEPCRTMLNKNLCLGCVKLENENFLGDYNCNFYVNLIKNKNNKEGSK